MVNRVILLGRLGSDPELKHTPNGAAVCTFSLATSETWKDKVSGQRQEKTEWHRVVVWSKMAEICQQYLAKGRQVYVEGKLQTRSWDDKDGTKRYTTEILAQSVQFVGANGASGGGAMSSDGADYGQGFGGGNGGGSNQFASRNRSNSAPAHAPGQGQGSADFPPPQEMQYNNSGVEQFTADDIPF